MRLTSDIIDPIAKSNNHPEDSWLPVRALQYRGESSPSRRLTYQALLSRLVLEGSLRLLSLINEIWGNPPSLNACTRTGWRLAARCWAARRCCGALLQRRGGCGTSRVCREIDRPPMFGKECTCFARSAYEFGPEHPVCLPRVHPVAHILLRRRTGASRPRGYPRNHHQHSRHRSA